MYKVNMIKKHEFSWSTKAFKYEEKAIEYAKSISGEYDEVFITTRLDETRDIVSTIIK